MKQKLFKRLVPLFLFCCCASFSVWAQNININYKDTPIKSVLKEITRQSGYTFVYSDALKEVNQNITITYTQQEGGVDPILKKIFAGTGITWSIKGKQVALFNKQIQEGRTAQAVSKGNPFQLRGSVRDESGEVLPGVTIHNKRMGKTVASDLDGTYRIEAKEGDVILFSSIGMVDQQIPAGKSDVLNVILKPDVIALEDVVVTGYQTISKERATGSFETIGAQQLNKPSTSLEQSIIGNVSGIQMVNKGYRDREESIVIRGTTSLGANSNPLIIVDGFAIEGTLSSINPNDIANITVLKDAAAASIWGARSANGVIVVTTKAPQRGKESSKVNVELNAFVRFSGKMDLDYANPLAGSAETIEYERMGFETNFFKRGSPIGNNYASAIYNSNGRMYSPAVVAMNENRLGFFHGDLNAHLAQLSILDNRNQIRANLLSAPVTQQYNLTISGGNEKLSNILTVMYDNNIAAFKGNDDQRYTFNYRTNLNLFKWLDVNVGSMFQYSSSNNNGVTLAEIQEMSPYDMLLGEKGEYLHIQKNMYLPIIDRYITQQGVQFPYADWTYNPVREMRGRDITSRSIYGRVQAGLKLKIIKGLTFDSKFQYEIMDDKNQSLYSEDTYQVRFNVNYNSQWNGNKATTVKQNYANGMAISEGSNSLDAWNFRNQLTFDRTFGDHTISAIAGTEVSKRVYQSTTNSLMYGYNDELLSITPPLNGISAPTSPLYNMFGGQASINYPSPRKSYSVDKYFSMYGNASYTYKSKYTVSGSVRTDASNLISSDPSIRYSPFWSVGAAWSIKQESFMKNISWIDRLVLRGTYGFNGNVDKSTSVDPLISIWEQNPSTGTGYGVISNYGNPNLGWEKTGSLDIGVDFALFGNKLTGKIDYYDKQGRDLISTVAIANVYGTDTQSINAVSMYNRGIEVTVGSFLQKGKFSWSGNLSFSYNKNKITKLFKDKATLAYRIYGPQSGWEYAEGYDAGTLWAFKYGGIQEVGGVKQPVIVDKDGKNPRAMTSYNTSFDTSDYLLGAGTAVPPYVLGFNSSFRYGNFNLSFIITGYFGHKFKRVGFNYPTMNKGTGNINKYYDEIKNCDPNEFVPLPIDGMYPSRMSDYVGHLDNLILNAANIRFQEINLTYDLPRRAMNSIGLGGISVYGQLNNVGVITFNGYGQDPFYPIGTEKPRTAYTFGVKINF